MIDEYIAFNTELIKLLPKHAQEARKALHFLNRSRFTHQRPEQYAKFKWFLDDNLKHLEKDKMCRNQIVWLYEQFTSARGGVKMYYDEIEENEVRKHRNLIGRWVWAAEFPDWYSMATPEQMRDCADFYFLKVKSRKVPWDVEFNNFMLHVEAFGEYFRHIPMKEMAKEYKEYGTLSTEQWHSLLALCDKRVRIAYQFITKCEDDDIPKLPVNIRTHIKKMREFKSLIEDSQGNLKVRKPSQKALAKIVRESNDGSKLVLQSGHRYAPIDLIKRVERSKIEFIDTLLAYNEKGTFFIDADGHCYDRQPGHVWVEPVINNSVSAVRERLEGIRNGVVSEGDLLWLRGLADKYKVGHLFKFIFKGSNK